MTTSGSSHLERGASAASERALCVCVCVARWLSKREGEGKRKEKGSRGLWEEKKRMRANNNRDSGRGASPSSVCTLLLTQLWDMLFGANVLRALICVHGVYIWRETHRYEQTGTDVILISFSLSLSLCVCVCASLSLYPHYAVCVNIYISITYVHPPIGCKCLLHFAHIRTQDLLRLAGGGCN